MTTDYAARQSRIRAALTPDIPTESEAEAIAAIKEHWESLTPAIRKRLLAELIQSL